MRYSIVSPLLPTSAEATRAALKNIMNLKTNSGGNIIFVNDVENSMIRFSTEKIS